MELAVVLVEKIPDLTLAEKTAIYAGDETAILAAVDRLPKARGRDGRFR